MTTNVLLVAQALSGYPDARVGEIDTLINLLQVRLTTFPDLNTLRPLDAAFRKGALDLISSRPNVSFMQPSARSQPAILGGESLGQLFWSVICKPCIYALLFGIPRNYQRRLGRADWIQWASSKRWIDQQQAMDGFLKSLISEWNLMILLSTLILSTSVGFLSINDIDHLSLTAVMISLVFSLGSIVLDVAFIWRYQRQLTNTFDMRTVMDEFIFNANDEILAVYLALPIAFLLWSVLAFFVAVLCYAWGQMPDRMESGVGVTAIVGVIGLLTAVFWVLHRFQVFVHWRDARRGWAARASIDLNIHHPAFDPKHRAVHGEKETESVLGASTNTSTAKPLDEAGSA